jgi:hypothetical protein
LEQELLKVSSQDYKPLESSPHLISNVWNLDLALNLSQIPDINLVSLINSKYAWVLNQIDLTQNEDWKLDDIVDNRLHVYTQKHERNSIFRSEILAPYPIDILISYLNNQKQRLNNRGRIKSFKKLRHVNENIFVEGTHLKGVWPVSDRVTSNYVCEFYDERENYINIEFDTEQHEYDVKNTVRVKTDAILWRLEPIGENSTRMIYYVNSNGHLDSLPGWVIKKAMKDGMHLPLKIVQILEEGKPLELPNNGK